MIGTSTSDLWEEEYRKGGIPSSVREEPSGAVMQFVAECLRDRIPGRALDIGCGSGRNALFLAENGYDVEAFDYVVDQIERLKATAEQRGLAHVVHARVQDIRARWPLPDAVIDVAVDAFCFKHQIAPPDIENYVNELHRVMVSGARYMLSFAGRQDGYYAQFPVSDAGGPGQVIVDPHNAIASRLYDVDDMEAILRPKFVLLSSQTKAMQNIMHGGSYSRVTHVTWWGKP